MTCNGGSATAQSRLGSQKHWVSNPMGHTVAVCVVLDRSHLKVRTDIRGSYRIHKDTWTILAPSEVTISCYTLIKDSIQLTCAVLARGVPAAFASAGSWLPSLAEALVGGKAPDCWRQGSAQMAAMLQAVGGKAPG